MIRPSFWSFLRGMRYHMRLLWLIAIRWPFSHVSCCYRDYISDASYSEYAISFSESVNCNFLRIVSCRLLLSWSKFPRMRISCSYFIISHFQQEQMSVEKTAATLARIPSDFIVEAGNRSICCQDGVGGYLVAFGSCMAFNVLFLVTVRYSIGTERRISDSDHSSYSICSTKTHRNERREQETLLEVDTSVDSAGSKAYKLIFLLPVQRNRPSFALEQNINNCIVHRLSALWYLS